MAWLGLADSPAYPGEPECNGCAERWIKTLTEQCLWARSYRTVDELRQAVAGFVELYDGEGVSDGLCKEGAPSLRPEGLGREH